MKAAVALLVLLATPAAAADSVFPIDVPPACQALAAQHGIPQTITNKAALTRAIWILAKLNSKDEAVRECRAVVKSILGK